MFGSLVMFGLFSNVAQAGIVQGATLGVESQATTSWWEESPEVGCGPEEWSDSHRVEEASRDAEQALECGLGEGCGTSSPTPTGGASSCPASAEWTNGARAEAQAASGWVRVAQLVWNVNPIPQDLLDPPKA